MNLHDPLVQLAITVILVVIVWFFCEYRVEIEHDDEDE